MKSILLISSALLLATTLGQSQVSHARTETFKVDGNCGLCKTAIEKAGSKKNLYKTEWNADNKTATLVYNSKATTADAVLKNIALAGYDNEKFLAPDDAYEKLAGCCRYVRERKQPVIPTTAMAVAPLQVPANQPLNGISNTGKEEKHLKAVFESYFTLKDALVKTDEKAAATKAKDLQAAINAVQMEKLPMEVHLVWMKVLNVLKEDAGKISATKDIAKQREYFMRLSENMYALVKAVKPSETVYYQFCPMANEGKGANWLSKESGIKNPYYGSQMLTCGKTVETIKQ